MYRMPKWGPVFPLKSSPLVTLQFRLPGNAMNKASFFLFKTILLVTTRMESKNVWAGLLRDQGFVNCIARDQVLQHYDSTVCLEILN